MKPNKQIKNAKQEIQSVMQSNLALIADSIISQVVKKARSLPDSQKLRAIKDIRRGNINVYRSDLKAALAVVSSDALDQARSEVPAAKNVKLMENEERLLFGEFEELPPKIRRRINASNELLIGTQIADLEKAIFFQFNSSVIAEKDLRETEFDMKEKSEKYIEGNAIKAGAGVTAANMVNEARNAFFFEDETLEKIEAFQFMNEEPVSDICRELAGIIFSKDDPNAFRYTGPLHYNCDSWIRPILKLKKNQAIERLEPKTKGAKESIQFSDIIKDLNRFPDRCCGF